MYKIVNNIFIFALTIVMSAIGVAGTQQNDITKTGAEKEQYQIINPATEEQLYPIRQWIKCNEQALKEDGIFYVDELQYLTGYLLDINNDGKQEYVFVGSDGRLSCLMLYIFGCNNTGFHHLKMPYEPDHRGLWQSPLCDGLFVKAQGKIYICTTEFDYYAQKTRDIYCWEKDTLSFVCDNFWIKQQRILFNDFCNRNLYKEAYEMLNEFENRSRFRVEPTIDLELRSDVSMAALKNNNPVTALSIINDIQKDTAFSKVSGIFQQKIKNMAVLCEQEIEKQKSALTEKYDFTWLLECSGCEIAGFDSRFEKLLAAIVPVFPPAERYRNNDAAWKDQIQAYFCGQFYGYSKVIENRYVVSAGHMPHNQTNKGFLWCDMQEKIGIVAITTNPICVTSKNVEWEELPAQFFDAFKEWLLSISSSDKSDKLTPAIFYDRQGTPFPLYL